MNDLRIRPYQGRDKNAVVALWQSCGLTKPWNDPQRDIDRKLTVQPELFVVAELDARVVGAVMAGFDGHRGWVNYLAVEPDQRGRGIGRSLMAHCEQALERLGCPKLNLQVRESNSEVLAFYRAIGYQIDPVVSLGKRLIADN